MINAPQRTRDLVVIGASAGGVEASCALLSGLPAGFPAAIVLVIHLSPFFESRLPQVLGRRTPLRAVWVEDGANVIPGTVHVARPDHHVRLAQAPGDWPRLGLDRGPRQHYTRPAIDPLFMSAARVGGERVVGVLLSGANDDGVLGLTDIGRAGGLVLVQDPEEAGHARMPSAGLIQNSPHAVLRLDSLARALQALATGEAIVVRRVTDRTPRTPRRMKDDRQVGGGGRN